MKRVRRGASAIEFALCLPLFLSIVFSIIEYGWVFFQQANVISAVREGARYAVTQQQDGACVPTNTAVDRVKATLTGLGYNSAVVTGSTVTETCQDASPEEKLRVSADVPYTPIIGLVPVPDEIHAELTMMLEYQD